MNNVETMLEIVSTYFGRNPLLLLCILGFIVLWKKVSRQNRIYMAVVCLCAGLFVYNDILYKLAQKIGEQNSFYRVLWIVPVVGLSAYLCIEVYGMLKYKTQRLTFVLLFAVLLFLYNNSAISNWTTLPSNIYQLPDEVIAVADVIEKDSGGERVNFCDDEKELSNLMRLYNANICVPIENTSHISYFWNEKVIEECGRQIRNIIKNSQIDYVAVEKERIDSQRAMESGGCRVAGETPGYVIYATDRAWWADYDVREKAAGLDMLYITSFEHIGVADMEGEALFLYLNPVHIKEHPEWVSEWEARVESLNVKGIFVGNTLVGESEEGFQMLEYEDFVVVSLDNRSEVLDKKLLAEFDEANQIGKPIVLMLREPLNAEDRENEILKRVLSEESQVVQVFASDSEKYKKELLSDEIIQCSGFMEWIDTTETMIIIKGQE